MKNHKIFFILSLCVLLTKSGLWGMEQKVKPTPFELDQHFYTTYFFDLLDQKTLVTFRLVTKNFHDWVTEYFNTNDKFIRLHGAKKLLSKKSGCKNFLSFIKEFGPCIGIVFPENISQMKFSELVNNESFQEKAKYIKTYTCKNVYDFASIAGCKKITWLNLSSTGVIAPDLELIFQHLSSLRDLRLNYLFNKRGNIATIPDHDIAKLFEDPEALKNISKLKTLCLNGTMIRNKALETISNKLPDLQDLDLTYNNQLSNFRCLGKLKKLKEIYISANNSSSQDIELMLNNSQQLKILELLECENLKNFPWQKLASLKKLEVLKLRGAPLTNEHLKSICQLSKLHTLHLFNCCENVTNYSPLHNLTKPQSLVLTSTPITNDQFKKLMNELNDLRSVNINYCRNITDFSPISNHKNLTFLSCDQTKIDDQALSKITTNCPKLRLLALNRCNKLTQFKPIAHLPELEELYLEGLTIDHNDLLRIAKQLPKLKHISCSIRNRKTLDQLKKIVPTVFAGEEDL